MRISKLNLFRAIEYVVNTVGDVQFVLLAVYWLLCTGRNDKPGQDLADHSHCQRSCAARWCWRLRQTVSHQAGFLHRRIQDFPDHTHSVSGTRCSYPRLEKMFDLAIQLLINLFPRVVYTHAHLCFSFNWCVVNK